MLLQVFFWLVYCRRKQRLRQRLWGVQVPFFCCDVSPRPSPSLLAAVLGLQQFSSPDASKGNSKAASSWTILQGYMVPLLSYRLKSGQLETQGVLKICLSCFAGSRCKKLRRLWKWMWRWLLEVCLRDCLKK